MPNSLDTRIFSLFVLLPTPPAAGANFAAALSTTRRLEILHVEFRLTTSGDPANRLVTVEGDAVIGLNTSPSPVVQTATQVFDYKFSIGVQAIDWTAQNGTVYAPLAAGMFSDPSNIFNIVVANIQAADQLSSIIFTGKEWASIT